MRFDMKRASLSMILLLISAGISLPSRAANICDETVPANRQVDGIPAYSQCSASSGAVYSNNGVDTGTISGGTGWVRTQMSGGYQCTELAHRYLTFKWNVATVPNGNAGTWCSATLPTGLSKSTTPVHGDLIVFAPGSCGADSTTGHVAIVDEVNTNAKVTIVEQNSASRRSCALTCADCFLHVVANDGSGRDGGPPDSAPLGPDAVGLDSLVARDAPLRSDAPPTSGQGGAVASGGVPGMGGTGGKTDPGDMGGVSGIGGAPGFGGSTASDGGTTGSAANGDKASDGCGCGMGDRGRASGIGVGLVLLAGLLLRRRRRW
jgi:MYXO-CTERM domain-containing protein